MSEPDPKPPVRPKKQKSERGVSRGLVVWLISLTAVVGFIAGTRSNDIAAVLAPVFGFRVEAGEIDLSSVQQTFRQLKLNFDGDLDESALIDGANRGLVDAAGDQYTVFMTAEEARAFNNDLSGNIGGGIGAEIGMRSDKVTIIRLLKDNPAEEAGLAAGDTILAVNDESALDWTVEETVSKIRGEEGTTVKLLVQRGGETKDFTVTRRVINNPSVTSSVENGIGVLQISRFDDETVSAARRAAQNFKNQNVRGVVLDLRGNGGGYLEAARDVAGLWLKDKVVVIERTQGRVTDELRSGSNALLEGVPTVVLINGGSASASEIVAGALSDHKAATLIGEKSFGKGSVQKMVNLTRDAVLKVTVARWYTPSGKNIAKDGITPDMSVDLTQEDFNAGRDPQLDAAKERLAG